MKLTQEDKFLLKSIGCLESDFAQIELAAEKTTYILGKRDGTQKRISVKAVNDLLDRKVFLSGLNRSSFHYSAVRETIDGELIYFDSSRYFKD